MVNLKDSQGQEIRSGPDHWYKIVLRDGSELMIDGIVSASRGAEKTYQLATGHAGQGMVVRYQRYNGDDRLNQGWPIGDKGYLRCGNYNGKGNVGVFTFSAGGQHIVATDRADLVHGLRAEQMAGNRVSLYGYDKDGKLWGIQLAGKGDNLRLCLDSDTHLFSTSPVGLDCEFVKVSNGISRGLF